MKFVIRSMRCLFKDMSIHSDLDVNILIVIHMILNGSTKHQRKRKKHKLKVKYRCISNNGKKICSLL